MSWVTWDTSRRRLALVVRIDDYWTGTPVPHPLEVRLPDNVLPVPGVGRSHRQADGTYRFIDLSDGPAQVEVSDPTGRWAIEGPPIAVTLPLADPTVPRTRSAWPTPTAPDPAGQTRVRGRLVDASGTPLAAAQVEIDPPAGTFVRHALSDANGEFVYAITGFVPPESDGTLRLEARSGTAVVSTRVLGGTATPGGQFHISPGRTTRLFVEVVP